MSSYYVTFNYESVVVKRRNSILPDKLILRVPIDFKEGGVQAALAQANFVVQALEGKQDDVSAK